MNGIDIPDEYFRNKSKVREISKDEIIRLVDMNRINTITGTIRLKISRRQIYNSAKNWPHIYYPFNPLKY